MKFLGSKGTIMCYMNAHKIQSSVHCWLGIFFGILLVLQFKQGQATNIDVIKIGAIGDVLFHKENQQQAFSRGSYKSIWKDVVNHFREFDILYANFEGVSANVIRFPNGSCSLVNKSKPEYGTVFRSWEFVSNGPNVFNYHSSLVQDLKQSGIDVVSVANNHIRDLCDIGMSQTLKVLDDFELPYIGGKINSSQEWYKILSTGNHKTAWIACTALMNYNTKSYNNEMCKDQRMVLCCDNPIFLNLVSTLSRSYPVIATIHGGKTNSYSPSEELQNLVFKTLEAGAILIIGNHPHVSQPIEVYKVHNRRTAVVWSVGNFISHQGYSVRNKYQRDIRKRSSGILTFQLKPFRNGWEFDCFDYVPICVECREIQGVDEYFVRDVRKADCKNEGRWLKNVWGDWGSCRILKENQRLESKYAFQHWFSHFVNKQYHSKPQGKGKCMRDENVFNYTSNTFE